MHKRFTSKRSLGLCRPCGGREVNAFGDRVYAPVTLGSDYRTFVIIGRSDPIFHLSASSKMLIHG